MAGRYNGSAISVSIRRESQTTILFASRSPPASGTIGVEIHPGRKHVTLAIVHDPHYQKRRLAVGFRPDVASDVRQPENMTIALLFVDVDPAQRDDAVDQHPLGGGINDAGLHAGPVVLGGRDLVEAVVQERIRPGFQLVVVDASDVGRLEREDAVEGDGVWHVEKRASDPQMVAVALPETAHGSFGGPRALAGRAGAAHFHDCPLADGGGDAAPHEAADATIFHRHVAGGACQVVVLVAKRA